MKKGMMKKICLCVGSFGGGGAERVMITLANYFTEQGYTIDFVVKYDMGEYYKNLNTSIRKIVLIDKKGSRIKNTINAFLTLYRYILNDPPDVMMSSARFLNEFVSFVWIITGKRFPLILRETDTLDRILSAGKSKKYLTMYLMRLFHSRVKKVIANSIATKADLVNYLGLKDHHVVTIYNPMLLKEISCFAGISKSDSVLLVACGRLDKKKNFSDLIFVFPLVHKFYPDLQILILGEGEERKNLQHQIDTMGLTQQIKLKGFVDNPYYYFSKAHVFVQTSFFEGFGYVLAEAMACGTPVVAYDGRGAMREILKDGKYGKLITVGDLNALAGAIVEQIKEPTPPRLLKEAVKRFDIEIIAKEYLQTLGMEG